MYPIQIKVKNYRCFSEQAPLRLSIDRGFMALVGANNPGKSSFLRLFYELRPIFFHIRTNLPTVLSNPFGGNPAGVPDPEEVYFNGNDRDIRIQINLGPGLEPAKTGYRVDGLVIHGNRSTKNWKAEFLCNNQPLRGPIEKVLQDRRLVENKAGETYSLADLTHMCEVLERALYVPAYRNAVNQGGATLYDIAIGQEFVNTWDHWRTGGMVRQANAVLRVGADIERIFGYSRLEINASQNRHTIVVVVNGKSYELASLGSGLAQFIMVLANAAIKQPSFILIDEPELNLHPTLQLDFLTALATYSAEGVIFATHSIGLAKMVTDRIYAFRKRGAHSEVGMFGPSRDYAEFLGEMSFSSYREMGHDTVLMVEGPHDVLAVQQLLRKRKKDHRIVLLPLGGSTMINGDRAPQLEEVRRLSAHAAALVDSERTGPDSLPAERAAFAALCEKLGIRVCTTRRRALENYFTDRAIKEALGSSYSQLGEYQALKDAANGWSKADNWRIASSMQFSEVASTDVGEFLEQL